MIVGFHNTLLKKQMQKENNQSWIDQLNKDLSHRREEHKKWKEENPTYIWKAIAQATRDLKIENYKRWWNSLSEVQKKHWGVKKSNDMKSFINSLTEEERKEIFATYQTWASNASEEELQLRGSKISEGNKGKLVTNETKEKISRSYATRSTEELQERANKISQTKQNKSQEEKDRISQMRSNTYQNKSEEDKQERANKISQRMKEVPQYRLFPDGKILYYTKAGKYAKENGFTKDQIIKVFNPA